MKLFKNAFNVWKKVTTSVTLPLMEAGSTLLPGGKVIGDVVGNANKALKTTGSKTQVKDVISQEQLNKIAGTGSNSTDMFQKIKDFVMKKPAIVAAIVGAIGFAYWKFAPKKKGSGKKRY